MAQIDLNEAPSTDKGVTQSQVDEKVQYAKKLMTRAKLARSQFDKKWQTWRDYEKGKQFGNQKRARYKSRTAINICRSTIQAQIPILTDAEPAIAVQPPEPSDIKFAEMASEVLEHWWKNNDMHLTTVDWLMDAQIVGTGILKVTWNPDLQDGIGDVEVRIIDPKNFYVNPEAAGMTMQKGMRYAVERIYRTVGELKRKFPDNADQIHADSAARKDNSSEPSSFNEEITLQSPVNEKSDLFEDQPQKASAQEDTAEVWEIWEFNDTVEEQKLENKETKEFESVFKKKYPNGRLLTILPNQNLTLSDGENPYKDGQIPYVRLVDTQKPRVFWGEGEIEPLEQLQDLLNKTVNNIADYMNFTGNPVWYVHKRSGVNPNKITNRMGMILPWDGERADFRPFRDIPPALPAYYFEFVQTIIRMAEGASGIQEVSQGRRPEGITAAQALEVLQDAAQTRIRLKERNMRSAFDQLGKLIASRQFQYYRETRVFKITNEEGWPSFFEFTLKDEPDGKLSAIRTKTDTRENEETGELETIPGQPEQTPPTKGFFDVTFQSGTSLPFQKNQRQNLAFKLFEGGVLQPKRLLKDIEYPNHEEVSREFDEAQSQALEAEAQQEGEL